MRKHVYTFIFLISVTLLTACSVGTSQFEEDLEAPPVSYMAKDEQIEGDDEEIIESEDVPEQLVERELYLIDANGLVVPQTFEIPKAEGVLKQSLEYLVQDGPVSNLLPNGFQAVLPAGTTVQVNLKDDGIAIADFSPEFHDYDPALEQQILQAITWTLTQFDNVESVQIQVNGYIQKEMPKGGTPIGQGVSREDGINIEKDRATNIVQTKGITLYFIAENGDSSYFVPVTRRSKIEDESLAGTVNELLKGPSLHMPLLTDFRNDVELVDEPLLQNGQLTLNFNEAILSEQQSTAISEGVMQMLALTLTEKEEVETIALKVNGHENVIVNNGEKADKVSRPVFINK